MEPICQDGRDTSFVHKVKICSEARPTLYPMAPGAISLLPARLEADHTHQYIAEVKNARKCTPPYVMSVCLIKQTGNFLYNTSIVVRVTDRWEDALINLLLELE
jgi:hypothetical protein